MENNSVFQFEYPTSNSSIIKVIGVGGGGGNAVAHMYKEGIHDVSFVLCNTDKQALDNSDVPRKIQLGEGLGAGNKPKVAKQAAEESEASIREFLDDGTKMVFITAGMGGGTGTGAAPVIARISKEMGILTVAIVTIPFMFEGKPKILQALDGVEEISKYVDALLVVNNERLMEIYQNLPLDDAFKKADDTLTIAAKSIAEIITLPGVINLDFADVNTTLRNGGVAIMSSGSASGDNRISKAIDSALRSPLLDNNDVFKAKKILLNVVYSESATLMTDEMLLIRDFMSKFNKDIHVIWGTAKDETLEDQVRIIILATGFGVDDIPQMKEKYAQDKVVDIEEAIKEQEEAEATARKQSDLIEKYYGKDAGRYIGQAKKPKPIILSDDQLDDDAIIELLAKNPSYNRTSHLVEKLMADTIARRKGDE